MGLSSCQSPGIGRPACRDRPIGPNLRSAREGRGMSKSASLYVGPYAMWEGLRPPGQDVLPWDVFEGWWSSVTGVIEVEFGGGQVRAFCVVPSQEYPRPGGPKHMAVYMNSGEWYAALDLSGIDREAELEAFRRTYEQELRGMAEALGREPVLRWGVIYGYE